jgi:4'-phosphopantetheinyl transferase
MLTMPEIISTYTPFDTFDYDTIELLTNVLCESEIIRYEKLKDEKARCQYLVAHTLLRRTLSFLLPINLAEWQFTYSHSGKPVINVSSISSIPHFSISHTDGLAICAVSKECSIGVDAEKIDKNIDFTSLWQLTMSKAEQEQLATADSKARSNLFYKLWTLKESILKATGKGLELPLSQVSIYVSDDNVPELQQLPVELGRHDEWSLNLFAPSKDHICALAVKTPNAPQPTIHWYETSLKNLIDDASNVRKETSLNRVIFPKQVDIT